MWIIIVVIVLIGIFTGILIATDKGGRPTGDGG
jgi:uncharacterized protein YneF (UPF0154 family)